MAKAAIKQTAEEVDIPNTKDNRLRISLRIKDRETEKFLKQMGQVQRAMFIELAVIKYIREGNDDTYRLLTGNVTRGGGNGHGHPTSSDAMPIAAKQVPVSDTKPLPVADITDDNFDAMDIGN